MRVHLFRSISLQLAFVSVAAAFALMISGCASSTRMTTVTPTTPSPTTLSLKVQVLGGRQPVSNSSILLSEMGNFGRGTSNGLATANTDSNGDFNIASFTCQNTDSQVFITASGGDAGNGYNSNIFLMAMLGPCNNLPSTVVINEFSTIAAVYAFNLGMLASNPQQVGTDGSPGDNSYIGATNAGTLLTTDLVNVSSGKPAAFLSSGLNSPKTMNTLADILVACVDASPANGMFQACNDLYAAATPSGGSTPSNTLQAAFLIASNPGNNVSGIFHILSEVSSSVPLPYEPVLTTAPNDWTVGLNFKPGDLSNPRGMAIGLEGNVWIANSTGGSDGTGSVTVLNPAGVEISPKGGFTAANTLNGPQALAFVLPLQADTTGDLWVTNLSGDSILAFENNGDIAVNDQATQTLGPSGVVTDSFGNVWVTASTTSDSSKELGVLTSSGTFSFFVGGFGLNDPISIIADTTVTPNIMWVANSGTGGVSRIVNDGTSTLTGQAISGGGQTTQKAITLDNNGDAWVSNSALTDGSVTKISGTSVVSGLGQVTAGGITSTSRPWGIAADSKNNVFVNNFSTNSVTQLDVNGNAVSPSTGFTAGGLISSPREGIAIDRAGNVWVVNSGNNTVTVLVGASGGPVVTPITAGRAQVP